MTTQHITYHMDVAIDETRPLEEQVSDAQSQARDQINDGQLDEFVAECVRTGEDVQDSLTKGELHGLVIVLESYMDAFEKGDAQYEVYARIKKKLESLIERLSYEVPPMEES